MMRTDPPETLPHPLEPQLRKLGLPTQLKRGVPTLLREHVVCKKGQVLTADAVRCPLSLPSVRGSD
jgi:mRNA turnover protein 4